MIKGALALFLLVFVGVVFWGSWEYSRISSNLPSPDQLPLLLDRSSGELLIPTRIYDRTGKILLSELGSPAAQRKFLSVDPAVEPHFSSQLLTVVTQIQQPDYWQSSGVDFARLTDPSPHTIAEQLVHNLLLAGEPETSLIALRMRLLASQVVHQYGRDQVLEWYLNSLYLDHETFGAEAASQLYLGKSAQDLSLAEAALIVALIDSPALNPLDSPAAALDLQQAVLDNLEKSGAFAANEIRQARLETLHIQSAAEPFKSINSAFIKNVKNQLEPSLGANRLERGGLIVITTLDADLQFQLQCTAQTQLFRIENSSLSGVASENTDCPAALLLPTQNFSAESLAGLAVRGVIVDPEAGQVLAYLPPTTQFSDILPDDAAQPGSLLAPVVALAGFARGESPSSLLWDIPATVPTALTGAANPDGSFHGPVSLRTALANDYLVPLAQLTDQISPAVTWQMGYSLGLDSFVSSPNSAQSLFQGGNVPLLELSQVYATLANSGSRNGVINPKTQQIDLNLVLRVETTSKHTLLDDSQPQRLSIISDSLAYLINHVLSDDTARYPSLGYPNALEIGRPSASKIGETQSRHQVWTAGYTPHRLVIIGIQQTDPTTNNTPLQPVMAAGLWNAMIQYASTGLAPDDWVRPAGVSEMQVCSPSGLLPTDACPNLVQEVFLLGNEPTYPDNLYKKVKINRETGLLATVFTPTDLVDEKVTMDVPHEAREWALAAGISLTPAGYDAIQTISQDPQVQISSPALFAPVAGKVEIRGTANNAAFKSFSIQIGEGINPSSWIQIGESQTTPVSDGVLGIWDTHSSDGLYAIRLSVVDQSNQVKTAIIQVTVDNHPPQVAILYPQTESALKPVMGVITFNATAVDDVAVARVEWWLDGKKVSETSAAPYFYIWQSSTGKHSLVVKAWDTAGNPASSSEVIFTVEK